MTSVKRFIKVADETNDLVNSAIKSSRLLPTTKALAPVATSQVKFLPAIKRFGSVAQSAVKAFK